MSTKNRKTGSQGKRPDAAEVLRRLIDEPVPDSVDVPALIASLDPADARRAAFAEIDESAFERAAEYVIEEVFTTHGIGPGGVERIAAWVVDTARPRSMRGRLVGLLSVQVPKVLDALGDRHPELDLPGLMLETQISDQLSEVVRDPSQLPDLPLFFMERPIASRPVVLELLLAIARTSGIPLALLSRPLLGTKGLQNLRGRILEVLVEEASALGQALLEEEARKGNAADREEAQAALLRLTTRRAEGKRAATTASGAWVSSCDGKGAFVVLVAFGEPPSAGLANVCLRLGGGRITGYFAHRFGRRELPMMLERLRASAGGVLTVRPAEAAALVARTGAASNATESEKIRVALLALENVTPEPLVSPEPAAAASLEALEALLRRPQYVTWLFDGEDLEHVPAPTSRPPESAWYRLAANLIEKRCGARVAAMARHNAWLHARAGEHEPAALLARAAADVERDFAVSPLVHAMLRKSVALDQSLIGHLWPVPPRTDPGLRGRIRRQAFGEVNAPIGSDLLRLDLTEAAVFALTDAFEDAGLPAPTEERLIEGATAFAANAMVSLETGRGRWKGLSPEVFGRLLAGLPQPRPDLREHIKQTVGEAFDGFLGDTCASCPVACLARPKAPIGEVFFDDQHPAT